MIAKQKIDLTICFLALIITHMASTANAQPRKDHRDDNHDRNSIHATHIGIQFGLDIADLASDEPLINPSLESVSKYGFAVNATVRQTLWSMPDWAQWLTLSAQSGLAFMSRGTNLDLDGERFRTYELNYIDIPILFRTSAAATPNIHPYLTFGPTLAVLLSAELEDSQGNGEDEKDNFTAIDIGMMLGGGVSFDIAAVRGAITFNAGYNVGLRNINATGFGGAIRNRVIAFTLGYEYRLR